MISNRNKAFKKLASEYSSQGYIYSDDIVDISVKFNLPLKDLDWLSGELTSKGVIIRENRGIKADDNIDSQNDIEDYSQIDYDELLKGLEGKYPSMAFLFDYIHKIIPPQRKELDQIKYQAFEGNTYAKKRMIDMFMRLAVKLAAQRAEAFDEEIEEFLGDAFSGLIIAVDKYDPDSNGAFQSHAAMWIFQSMSRNQSTKRPLIYYPVHAREPYNVIYPFVKEHRCYECDCFFSCEKLNGEVGGKVGTKQHKIFETLCACIPLENNDELSMHNDLQSSNSELADKIKIETCNDDYEIDKELIEEDMHKTIIKSLDLLRTRECSVISLRYGLDDGVYKSLNEVGQIMCITRERVRQIEAKALKKLQIPSLKVYLR